MARRKVKPGTVRKVNPPRKAKNTYNSKAIESIFGPLKKSLKKKPPVTTTTANNNTGNSNKTNNKKSKQKNDYANKKRQQQQHFQNLQLLQAQKRKHLTTLKKGQSSFSKKQNNNNKSNNKANNNRTVRKFKLQLPVVTPNCEPAPWWIDGSSSSSSSSSLRNNSKKSSSSSSNTKNQKILKVITVSDESMKLLNEELIAFSYYVKLGNYEIQARHYLIKIIQDITKRLWPQVNPIEDCQIFGSFAAQDVCTFESDIDMAIWNVVPPPPPTLSPSPATQLQSQRQSSDDEELELEGDDDSSDDNNDSRNSSNRSSDKKQQRDIHMQQPQQQNDSDLSQNSPMTKGSPIVHSNQRKQALIQKWKTALDDHFGLNTSMDGQQQDTEADSMLIEEKQQAKPKMPLEEGEKPATKEESNNDQSCLFVIDRVGDPSLDDPEHQQEEKQEEGEKKKSLEPKGDDLIITQQQPNKTSGSSNGNGQENAVVDGSTEAAVTVSEDSFAGMETDGVIPGENSVEVEMQAVQVDETKAPASEDISSQFADGIDTAVRDTQFEDAQEEEQISSQFADGIDTAVEGTQFEGAKEEEQDDDDDESTEGLFDSSSDGDNSSGPRNVAVVDSSKYRDCGVDDSDNDSADKLEGLKKRSRALSCDSETRLFNLPDTEDAPIYPIPPNPSFPTNATDGGEGEEKCEENFDTESSDDNIEEDQIEIIRKPRSQSMISLSSSTTAGSSDRRNDDFDSSGMEVSFVTVPSAAAANRGAATSDFGPKGETRVLINRRLNLLQKWLRRSGTIEQSHVRKNARIPIVNMLTCFGYEVDIAIGGHNGTDTSSYATKQIERFESFSPVVLFLKVLLSQNDLDKPFSGGLGSFKLYVLVANHIERHLKLGGSDSPGEILLTFLFRYGDVPGFGNIDKCARSALSQYGAISAAGGTADMSGVFQVQNCVTVFAASWHRLQSKLKRQVNPRHSLLRYLVDSEKLQARRKECQSKAKLMNRFSQSSVTPQNRRAIRCHSLPPVHSMPPECPNPPSKAKKLTPPPPSELCGTLSYNSDLRRHLIRGMNHENSTAFPPQRFQLARNLGSTEDPTEFPKDGKFHGSFSLPYYHTTVKGKQKERRKFLPERDVDIKFIKIEGGEGSFKVDGKGANQFGIFHITGTAHLSPNNDSEYRIVLRKRYESSIQPNVPAESGASNLFRIPNYEDESKRNTASELLL